MEGRFRDACKQEKEQAVADERDPKDVDD